MFLYKGAPTTETYNGVALVSVCPPTMLNMFYIYIIYLILPNMPKEVMMDIFKTQMVSENGVKRHIFSGLLNVTNLVESHPFL